jgi:hypothetical protein
MCREVAYFIYLFRWCRWETTGAHGSYPKFLTLLCPVRLRYRRGWPKITHKKTFFWKVTVPPLKVVPITEITYHAKLQLIWKSFRGSSKPMNFWCNVCISVYVKLLKYTPAIFKVMSLSLCWNKKTFDIISYNTDIKLKIEILHN